MTRLFVVISIFAALSVACTRSARISPTLVEADALMWTNPDTALIILQSLDSTVIASANQADRAHYGLLMTKASYFSYKDNYDDSLIAFSSDYYRGRGDSLETQALFFHGMLLSTRMSYDAAMCPLLEAYDLAEAASDTLYMAMSLREQAIVYHNKYMMDRAAELSSKAADCFLKVGKPYQAAMEKLYTAYRMSFIGKSAEAMEIMTDLKNCSIFNQKRFFRSEWYKSMIRIACENGDYYLSIASLDSALSFGATIDPKISMSAIKAYLALGRLDDAVKTSNITLKAAKNKEDRLLVLLSKAVIELARGNELEAYAMYGKYKIETEAVADQLILKPSALQIADYHAGVSKKRQNSLELERKQNILLTIIVVLCITVIALTFLYHRKKIKANKAEADLLRQEIGKLRFLIEEKDKDNTRMTEYMALQSRNKFNIINKLCRQATSSKDKSMTADEKKALADFLKMINTDDCFEIIEAAVNKEMGNIMETFKTDFPNLTATYYRIALYSFAGLSVNAVAMLLDTTINSVYVQKSNIKRTIKTQSTCDGERYLSRL